MLIDKIRKHAERIVYIRKPYTGVMEGIWIVDPKKRDQAVDAARCLEQHAVVMAQSLIAVDDALKIWEEATPEGSSIEPRRLRSIKVTCQTIRKAMESTDKGGDGG